MARYIYAAENLHYAARQVADWIESQERESVALNGNAAAQVKLPLTLEGEAKEFKPETLLSLVKPVFSAIAKECDDTELAGLLYSLSDAFTVCTDGLNVKKAIAATNRGANKEANIISGAISRAASYKRLEESRANAQESANVKA